MAKENGVAVVTFPPHTSHKLQPLDISVYGPFKRLYNREIDSWLATNGGKTVSIYELAELSGKAWSKAATSANIISGFASAGIHPFQPDTWTDDDFCLAQVTDRPNPQSCEDVTGISAAMEPSTVASGPVSLPDVAVSDEAPSTITADTHAQDNSASAIGPPQPAPLDHSDAVDSPVTDNTRSQTTAITPESIHPFPKAAPRKAGVVRKKLSSEVLTSTPVKERLKAEFAERKLKRKGQKRKLNVTEKAANEVTVTSVKTTRKGKSRGNSSKGKQLQQSRCSRPKKKKRISDSDDSDVEPECFCIICTEPGVIASQMKNGFSASVVTSGLILSAQLVHPIMFAITVTLRVSSCITAISKTLTLALLQHLRIYITSSM